jgi:cytochrome P450
MSLLLFGIITGKSKITLEADLRLIKSEGLAALVTASDTKLSRESAAVMEYGDKIMRIHQQATLIPMRYGSLLADENDVIKHLKDHAVHYDALLLKLSDCEEVGIRITLKNSEDETVARLSSGQAYLLARKSIYSVSELATQQETLINSALEGLYREQRAMLSVFNGQRTYLLSYLVPRAKLEAFKAGYSNLNISEDEYVIFSGPWPPYNFVD